MLGFNDGGRPQVVGHRGFPARERENTPASFAAAAAAGATWVELDVRRCADGLVVHHDARTADGAALVTRTAAQLAAAGVPTLETVLASLPPQLGVDVEVKNLPFEPDHDPRDRIVAALAPLLTAEATRRPLCVTSFNPRTVGALIATIPDVPAGLVSRRALRPRAALRVARRLGCALLCPAVSGAVDRALIAAAHAAGLAVMAWTVDDPARARSLAAAGVDALCTNHPDRIVEALREARATP